MDTFLMLFILTVGILFRLVEGDARHLVLRLAHHSRVEPLVGEEIVQIDIANHRSFQKIHILMPVVGIVTHKHVAGYTHQNGLDVDSPQQRGKQYTTVHTVDLRRIEGIIECTYPL